MNANQPTSALSQTLQRAGVHRDVLSWAETQVDWPSAWQACPRGDWLLGFAARFGSEPRAIGLATIEAVEAALQGTYLEPTFHVTLDATKSQLTAEDKTLDVLGFEGGSHDPNVVALRDVLENLRELYARPDVGAAIAAQTLSVVVAASGDCATMAVIGYTHQVMANAVRRVIEQPPPLPEI